MSLKALMALPHSHLSKKWKNLWSSPKFIDSKLVGDPLEKSRGKLDCMTSFFSLVPLLLLLLEEAMAAEVVEATLPIDF